MRLCVTVLDLGTSSFKCGNVDSEGAVTCTDIADFDISRDGGMFETDFEESFETVLGLLERAVLAARASDLDIEAVLITSQAQTFAPVDKRFRPLSRGIVWLDSRAREEARELDGKLEGFPEKAGFARVLPELYASKLLWLRRNKPAVFKKAVHFPLISEYIACRLTGRFFSDSTNFGMGGLLDIRTKRVNEQALEALGIAENKLPDIHPAAAVSYAATPEVGKRTGLGAGARVYLCGNDQSASSAGSGLKDRGDVSANFGTVMAVYALTEKPPVPDEVTQISGISPLGGYFLLSYDARAGDVIEKVKNELFPGITYDGFFAKYKEGASKGFDSCFEREEIDCDLFPSKEAAAAAVTDYFIRRLLYHICVIEKSVLPKKIYAGGGLMQSEVWADIVRKRCRYEVIRVTAREAGLIGAYKIYRRHCGSRGCPQPRNTM